MDEARGEGQQPENQRRNRRNNNVMLYMYIGRRNTRVLVRFDGFQRKKRTQDTRVYNIALRNRVTECTRDY